MSRGTGGQLKELPVTKQINKIEKGIWTCNPKYKLNVHEPCQHK